MSRLPLALFALASTVLLGGCSLGPTELLIIFAIILLLFGATRLPQLGKALGDTVKSFKESTTKNELEGEDEKKALDKEKEDVSQLEEAKVERVEKK
ncbi:MAG: twin-arginine translocase TatA/TatE family subunit [Deltaproteobacteria bacterium]|nr:twin-arginine translocase TatA/TatE family subunit [Deltaproteobacteria bacterium]